MEVTLNPNGTRNRDFRPYIEQEELNNSVYLYDPNRPFHYGLYDRAQPACTSWNAHYQKFGANIRPSAFISPTGRLHSVRRMPHRYESLRRNIKPQP